MIGVEIKDKNKGYWLQLFDLWYALMLRKKRQNQATGKFQVNELNPFPPNVYIYVTVLLKFWF